MSEEVLKLENICKSFSGNYVLRELMFTLNEGEVRALVGENGAGKSTMIKIIAGALRADSGKIFYLGKQVAFSSPKESLNAGISVMYQELDLLRELSVVQNVYLGIEEKNRFGMLNHDAMKDRVLGYLCEMNLNVNPNAKVGSLPIVMQQMVAAIKAMIHEAKIIIMDEPSSSLSAKELQILFGLIRKLQKENIAVVYVSHRLEEIFEICGSVTVLFNGRIVSTEQIVETNREKIIMAMVGREVSETRLNIRSHYKAPYILEVKNLSYKKILDTVSFNVKRGEIFGILGLVGSGVVDLGKLIYGIKKPTGGTICVNGKQTYFRSPADSLKNSISYVSEDRRAYGVLSEMSVEDNATIAALDKFLSFKPLQLINKVAIRRKFIEFVDQLGIKIAGIGQRIRFLSGGNQQKILIARALISDTEIIIFSSPTKGIDVGAKFDIYQILLNCVRHGKTIIVISQEITELVQICDSIVVLKHGKVFKFYRDETMSETLIYNELLS
jgi:ribose transport system ATP-binding protein